MYISFLDFIISQRLEELENSLRDQKTKIEEALLSKSSYEHVLDRMKVREFMSIFILQKDKIADKLKTTHIESELNAKLARLNEETERARKAKQEQLQTQIVFDEVTKHIETEDKKRKESLNIFLQTLKAKSEAERKR